MVSQTAYFKKEKGVNILVASDISFSVNKIIFSLLKKYKKD